MKKIPIIMLFLLLLLGGSTLLVAETQTAPLASLKVYGGYGFCPFFLGFFMGVGYDDILSSAGGITGGGSVLFTIIPGLQLGVDVSYIPMLNLSFDASDITGYVDFKMEAGASVIPILAMLDFRTSPFSYTNVGLGVSMLQLRASISGNIAGVDQDLDFSDTQLYGPHFALAYGGGFIIILTPNELFALDINFSNIHFFSEEMDYIATAMGNIPGFLVAFVSRLTLGVRLSF